MANMTFPRITAPHHFQQSPELDPSIPHTNQTWEQLNETLARYGHSVLRAWISNGSIFTRVYRLTSISLSRSPDLQRDPDSASEIAGITVAVALKSFRILVEEKNIWNPELGASLQTFFIGQCLLRFPNEYRRWLREHRFDSSLVDISTQVDLPSTEDDPAHNIVLHMEALRILADAPDRTRTVLAHTAVGYSQRDIAARMGTTQKGVEMIMRRHRNRTSACLKPDES
ncbi:sigma-70 RNA polymerase sigma factor region 4 domain-containing protein [Streptomyces violascens]|uniref:hypothetical protein n=1 Tax=Streptomyces violascens TaxID=67381 RepID=UPI0036B64F45